MVSTPQDEIKAVQMMPDHMHGVLFVTAPLPVHLGQSDLWVQGWVQGGTADDKQQ